jgi:formylaminopyrimidine deformylase
LGAERKLHQITSTKDTDIQRVFQNIDKLEEESLELLSKLISFNTTDPPAGNCAEAQEWLSQYLKSKVDSKASIDRFQDFPGDPHLVSTFGSKSHNGRSIIFNGHIDVAEVKKDEGWKYGAFTPKLEGGLFYGRGASDMKGGLTAMITSIRAIKECGIDLGGDVIFESVAGEEAGEAGTKTCIDKGYKADFAVISEPSNFKIQGQGGVITGWIIIKSPQTFHDGMRRYMIHAGGGVMGASAIEKMFKVAASLQDLERHWGVMKVHPKMPPGMTTINPSVIQGGRHPAFIADECRLWITVHLLPNETYEQVTKEIEDQITNISKADPWLRENPAKFIWGGKSMFRDTGEIFPPADINEKSDPVLALAQSHESVLRNPCQITMSPSVTDAGWFANAGIPVAIYGPGDLRQAHTVDEYVKWDSIKLASKVLAHLLLNWCK